MSTVCIGRLEQDAVGLFFLIPLAIAGAKAGAKAAAKHAQKKLEAAKKKTEHHEAQVAHAEATGKPTEHHEAKLQVAQSELEQARAVAAQAQAHLAEVEAAHAAAAVPVKGAAMPLVKVKGLRVGGPLETIATAFTAIDTGADIGHKIQVGVKAGREQRAAHRVQPSPQRAARWLDTALRKAGQDVDVKPGLSNAAWSLLVEYKRGAPTVAVPIEWEGYPVVVQQVERRRDRKRL